MPKPSSCLQMGRKEVIKTPPQSPLKISAMLRDLGSPQGIIGILLFELRLTGLGCCPLVVSPTRHGGSLCGNGSLEKPTHVLVVHLHSSY